MYIMWSRRVKMERTYKFRLYPNREQEEKLLFVLEECRWLYNSFLSVWNNSKK
ncbi:MAG: helix-turn-helix domain-containing protein, partial [Candidatus Methanospirareceae archaeon]